MLPAPARTASTPRPKSKTSWNPAVPPPPVAGAAAGKGLADGLGDGLALALGVVALALGVVVPALGVVVPPVLLAEAVGVAEGVTPGDKVGADEGGPPPVQAETDRETNIAKMTQPRAVPRKRRWPER